MKKELVLLISIICMVGCSAKKSTFDLQGHRGCRGLLPENTIPAFERAVDLGVTTLELDLAVTADNQLVVSHEPYLSSEICLDRTGNEIPDSAQLSYNIYKMTFEELRQFDCGLKLHPRFPSQIKMPVSKPRLEDVIRTIEGISSAKDKIRYNIEIKSQAGYDGIYHPAPSEFSEILYALLKQSIGFDRVTVQSFDFRVLQYLHDRYPEINLAVLIENDLPIHENLDSLGFIPPIYSCDFNLLSRQGVKSLQDLGMKVIPWTVNEVSDMKKLIDWGVDGLITDYPDRYFKIEK